MRNIFHLLIILLFLLEILDIEAIKDWEEAQYDPTSKAEMDKDDEFTVEVIFFKISAQTRFKIQKK